MKVINICIKSKKTMAVARNVSGQLKDVILLSRDAMHSAAYAVVRCMSVCPAVIFVYLSKGINVLNISSNFFSPSGSPTILVFLYQTLWQYSDRNSLKGASNAGGYEKIAIFHQCHALSGK